MTKHRDVNKCRRKKIKEMAALIRQTNSGYEMANKPEIQKEKTDGGREKQTNFL